MGRFALSFKVWWRTLTDPPFADAVRPLAEARALPAPAAPGLTTVLPASAAPAAAGRAEPARNDALNLLSVLQREARLVDFLKEDITAYGNEQIGAAVRDVHRDAAAALERMFALRPVLNQPEGTPSEVPPAFDAGRIRLVGNVTGQPPHRGTLRHPGWEASRVQLPEWSGSEKAARVVAPAEVEV
jgi:uncharacterized protein DUF2760